MEITAKESLYSELRRYQPARVQAFVAGEDEPKPFKPQGNRGQWKRLVDALPENTVRVEFLDSKGNVTNAFEVQNQVDAEYTTSKTGAQMAELLSLASKHADNAVDRALKREAQLLDGYQKQVDALLGQFTALAQMLADAVKVIYDSHALAGKAAAVLAGKEDGDDPMVQQFIAMAMQRLGAAQAPKVKPKNGA